MLKRLSFVLFSLLSGCAVGTMEAEHSDPDAGPPARSSDGITWSGDEAFNGRGFEAWSERCDVTIEQGEDDGIRWHIVVMQDETPCGGEEFLGCTGNLNSSRPHLFYVAYRPDLLLDVYHLRSVMAHELGHVLGNRGDHVEGTGDIMNPSVGSDRPSDEDVAYVTERGWTDCW